jgi:hypothetical protein
MPERILYSDVFRCPNCNTAERWLHAAIDFSVTFYFSRFTHCIRCGSARIERLARRDYIDGLSYHPVSVVLRLTGAPLKKCPACRLQYYDWRPVAPDPRASTAT